MTKQTQATPGPWMLTNDIPPSVYAVRGDDEPLIACTDPGSPWASIKDVSEAWANAALIAAAPDLLKVAEQALAAFSYLAINAKTKEDREEFARREAAARAALAKLDN